ncbi:MAG: helix-turn-helix domain-containing protein [Patescibacteria group bacterium]
MDKKILTIGKAAKYLGVSVAALRLWSNEGKIQPSNITPGGHRYYATDDLDRFAKSIVIMAKDWVYSQNPSEPQNECYCPDAQTFQSRLGKLETILKDLPVLGEEYSLISAMVGEMGNNSFDHNLGQWQDIRGIFFAYDPQKRTIVLADRGQGILKTLRRVRPQIRDDQEALKIAFTEVLSGRAPESRGNGLKFVRKIIKDEIKSVPIKLYFQTGSASLVLEQGNDYKMSTPEKNISGCLIILTY